MITQPMHHAAAPVITFDGLSACGKGTIALLLAERLQWHFLDSGALYRALAWAVSHYQVDPNDEAAVLALAAKVSIKMKSCGLAQNTIIHCDGQDISSQLRSELVSQVASIISVIPQVRIMLQEQMVAMRTEPGLVADGRDMGSVVFPDAELKFFLTAEPSIRAQRRYQQLKRHGINVNLRDIEREMQLRDQRDSERQVAPSKPAPDVILIDTTNLGVEQVFQLVLSHVHDFV